MNRALGTVLALIAVCLVLPLAASYAARAVPALLSLLILLVITRLASPRRKRR